MDHLNTPKKSAEPRDLDSSPVFFTGLINKRTNTKSTTLLCKLCNGNLYDNHVGDLCSDCNAIPREFSEQINQKDSDKSFRSYPTANQSGNLPSCSSNAGISPGNNVTNSILASPILNSHSALQNDLIESSILSLMNSDIKALLDSVQTPKRVNDNLKSKSSYRDRQEARSKAAPYAHSSVPQHQYSNHKALLNSVQTPKRVSDSFKSNSSYRDQNEARSKAAPYTHSSVPQHQYSNHKVPGPYHHSPPVRNGRAHTDDGPPVQYFNTPPSYEWSSPVHERYVQLSRDMWQLYHKNKQTEDVKSRKMALRDTLHDILRKEFDCALYVVGSSMTGLGAYSSDIDMCLMLTDSEIDQKKEALAILRKLRTLFRKCKFLQQIQLIPAKVPILRFIDSVGGVEVDLNINNSIGIRNTQLLSSYARIDERVAPLVILVKLWARHYDINDAARNSLSSYSVVLMVIHYLQYRCQPPVVPCLQRLQPDKYLINTDVRNLKLYEDLPNFLSENNKDLGELFVGFLNYFANEFNYNTVMSVRLGLVIPKEEVQCNTSPNNKTAHWKHVCIEEPFDLTNTARSVFDEKVFNKIIAAFHDSWCRLMENPDLYYVLS